ncbi:class I SAM-dependent methyltransferase [Nocardioides sp.]|uniref:class I SAM-dependent methyltransferase n=1 Tax=Nocardioides sp. TaxID=35761 RepID=UPI002ED99F3B
MLSAGHWRPDLRRSVRLLADFRHEQDDPRRFYSALAADSIGQLSGYLDLAGSTVLDVGGGPGYFRDAFERAGATYWALDADVGELAGLGSIARGTVVGDGMNLPFRDDAVDLCYSSNVLEHVARPWAMAEEMLRVTRPGGIAFLSYTVWYGPWGGHETAPWHYLGGRLARRRYTARHGHEPKNRYGESLFRVTVRDGLRWARRQQAGEVIAVLPRYNPRWAYWLTHVPVLRELVTWNLVIVVRKA